MAISKPGQLNDEHKLENFSCTSSELAKWLMERAHKNHREGASRCFVVCDESKNVVGYYALSSGSVSHEQVPGKLKRNMPHPIPVVVLGRLAVHAEHMRKGIGKGLLKDAIERVLQISEDLGVRALLCHAIDDEAKAFYMQHGFVESPTDKMTVMLSLKDARELLSQ